ncbi:MAG: SWIM zinc finger family protein, partial [Candidatus Yonathbacteria bacterium]|nr:SWIM zinc finger family protein [Candidatus Yonathbacteria bacterium]
MKLGDFEKHIDPVVRQRGAAYARDGLVRNLTEKRKDVWTASVRGTHTYRVEVTLSGGRIVASSCSCPYDLGDTCKHKVAVWLVLRDRTDDATRVVDAKPTMDAKSIIRAWSLEELREFVIQHSANNEACAAAVLAHGARTHGAGNRETFRTIVHGSIDAARDRDGFVGYWDADTAAEGADELLDQAEDALANGHVLDAAVRCQVVIEECIPVLQELDDSNGVFGEVIERAFELLMQSAAECQDETECKALFAWCLTEAPHERFDGWSDWRWNIMECASKLIKTDEEEGEWNRIADQLLAASEEDRKEHGWSMEYDNEQATKIRHAIEKVRRGDAAAAVFIDAHRAFPSMRRQALEAAWKSKDMTRVKDLADEGIVHDGALRGLVYEWKQWLLKASEREKNVDDIRAYARELFLGGQDNFTYYETLKKTYPKEEWSAVVDSLIQNIRHGGHGWMGNGSTFGEICVRE